MHNLYENSLYMEDIFFVENLSIPWEKLKNKSIMISGATGLIGSFLVDVLLDKDDNDGLECDVYALVRDEASAKKRFVKFLDSKHLHFVRYDVKMPLTTSEGITRVDYILHLASNTHPVLYATDPIGTITTNILGAKNLLDYSVEHNVEKFVLASSNEIYGENRGEEELFSEDYCGYIDCNTLRAGYPESKRCAEALCQAYREEKKLDVSIARFTRTYGPTMKMSDTKAISQFIKNGISQRDIILKSDGMQYYSYCYMSDAVSAVLMILLNGENGEAYNVAEEHSDIRLRDLASLVSKINGKKVVFDLPDEIEAAGYSKATKARLNGKKLQELGWKPRYDIASGVKRTIEILASMDESIY